MADVLIGWELGSGFGHVMPMLEIARRLRDHGHRPVLALNNVVESARQVREAGFAAVQSPPWQPAPRYGPSPPATASFADILFSSGLGDRQRIQAVLGAWDGLIDALRPKLVIAEFAPALCLAARNRVPLLAMGNGFALPPSHLDAFPKLLNGVDPLIPQDELLAEFNAALGARGASPLPALPAMFDADVQAVWTLPELDPYRSLRRVPAVGFPEPMPAPAPPPAEPHVFAYLGVEYRYIREVLDGLAAAAPLPVTVYPRGVPAEALGRWRRPGMTFLEAPPKLADVLARSTAAVHYGGLGTAAACLCVGRPQLAIPRQLERRLTAFSLERAGVAAVITDRFTPDEFATALNRVTTEPTMAMNARQIAAGLAERGHPDTVAAIVARSLELIDTA